MKKSLWCVLVSLILIVCFLPGNTEKFTDALHIRKFPRPLHHHLPTLVPQKKDKQHPKTDKHKPTPEPHNHSKIMNPRDPMTPLTIDKKLTGIGIDKSFHGVSPDWEQGEAEMADKYMGSCRNILEVGGGSGKVSHYLNRNLKNPQAHYVVEPSVWDIGNHLAKNREKHNDRYFLDKRKINDIPLSDIEKQIGPIDCIVSDCEGCMLDFYKQNPQVFTTASKIMNEMDSHNEELRSMWSKNGYNYLVKGCGCGGCGCDTDLWVKGPMKHPSHIDTLRNLKPQSDVPRKHQEIITPRTKIGFHRMIPSIQEPHKPRSQNIHPLAHKHITEANQQ